MESLVGKDLDADEMHLNNHNISSLTPELEFSPFLAKLFLQDNNNLTMIRPSFFQQMPVLQVLNLSQTSIQSLPSSISKLCLLKEFILQECSLLVEVPPEIGALKNLKLFDLEGTEIMYLPKEIGKLQSLERLRVSLSTYADDHKDRNHIDCIIPRKTISKLTKLKELSISVNPEAEWWEVELLEAIMEDLCFLPDLKTLNLYLPTDKALQQFLRLERNQVPIYSSLWNYRFLTGHCEPLPFSVQLDTEENFLKLEKCVKYMNGEGYTDEIAELIRTSRTLYLRRHWTIENLPVSDMRKMKYCLLMECNEMKTIINQDELHADKNKATNNGEDEVLGSLKYLAIHFMKKLQRILKGSISSKSLSCLRILALHSCPGLTSVFTECLLVNLKSLTEIIVEDCPKVDCLVNLEEGTPWRNCSFLPNLKRVSLIDLPELVSISGGVCIAPQLDTLLVFNCMRLDYLSVMELPRGMKVIKGEIEWWDALKYGKLTWENVFVQLKRDGSLMDQLAEDTNSLLHFLELAVTLSLPGNSLQVDQNSSRDHLQIDDKVANETQKMSTQKILNSNNGTAFTMWEPSCPVNGKPHSEDVNGDLKDPNHKLEPTKKKISSTEIAKWTQLRKGGSLVGYQVPSEGVNFRRKYFQSLNSNYLRRKYFQSLNSNYLRKCSIVRNNRSTRQVKVNKEEDVEKALDDGYIWRKYGQKTILGAKYPRSYYRCSFKITHNCSAIKHVQRSAKDPSLFEVVYGGKHTCSPFPSKNCSSTATESACRSLRSQDSLAATESASKITDSHFALAKWRQVLDINKNTSSSAMNSKWTQKVKASFKAGSDIPPDDSYIWRKYDEKNTFEAKYPRSYYKCTDRGCSARKEVQRSDDDPSICEITYHGMHTCLKLSVTSDSASATESALRVLKNIDSSTATKSALSILKTSDSSSWTSESASTITDNSSGPDYIENCLWPDNIWFI